MVAHFIEVAMIQELCSALQSDSKSSSPELFGDFRAWFTSKLTELRPDMVVAIARGAIRFMQFHPGALPDGMPFLSHVALPFLPDADLRGAGSFFSMIP